MKGKDCKEQVKNALVWKIWQLIFVRHLDECKQFHEIKLCFIKFPVTTPTVFHNECFIMSVLRHQCKKITAIILTCTVTYTGRTRSKSTKDVLDNGFETDDGLPDTCGPQRGKGMFYKIIVL